MSSFLLLGLLLCSDMPCQTALSWVQQLALQLVSTSKSANGHVGYICPLAMMVALHSAAQGLIKMQYVLACWAVTLLCACLSKVTAFCNAHTRSPSPSQHASVSTPNHHHSHCTFLMLLSKWNRPMHGLALGSMLILDLWGYQDAYSLVFRDSILLCKFTMCRCRHASALSRPTVMELCRVTSS